MLIIFRGKKRKGKGRIKIIPYGPEKCSFVRFKILGASKAAWINQVKENKSEPYP